VTIEPAMGKTDLFHDVGNADAVEARLSKPSRRGRDDLLPVFRHRLFAYLHCLPPPYRPSDIG
jgi:hypothetical protein